jgi:HEAT repeat protein
MRLTLIALFLASTTAFAGSTPDDHGWAEAEPTVTRNGMLRFTDGADFVPAAVPEILDRLENGGEGTMVRAALVEALRRTGAEPEIWGAAIARASLTESDAYVRMTMVDTLRRVPMTAETGVEAALAAGLASPNVELRASAARTMGGHAQGELFSSALIIALDDGAPEVRQSAAQAIGWLELDAGWAALEAHLGDMDATTRMRCIRALSRLDAERAAGLPAMGLLLQDPDTKVAQAARTLLD